MLQGPEEQPGFVNRVEAAVMKADTILTAWTQSTLELDNRLESNSLLSIQDAMLKAIGPCARAFAAAQHDRMRASTSESQCMEHKEHAEQLAHKLFETERALSAQKLDTAACAEAVQRREQVPCFSNSHNESSWHRFDIVVNT
jgi:hypothetical protein